MISADEARSMLEDQSVLTGEDKKRAEEKTRDAISQGRNIASLSFSLKDTDNYRKMYPLRTYLLSLGYNITFSNYTASTVMHWSW